MSPSSTSADFPRLTGADNFDVWKTRVRAHLDGKNLLHLVEDPNYDLNVSALEDDDEEMVSASDEDSDSDSGGNNLESSSSDDGVDDRDGGNDDDNSSVPAAEVRRMTLEDQPAQADGEVPAQTAPAEPPLPETARVESFGARNARRAAKTRKKQEKAKTRKKAEARKRAKAKALSVVKQNRRLNAQVKSFLMKTLDDKHIRIVKGFDKAYDIYQAICDRYKGTKAYGDPYAIMNYLYNARYQEGEDITEFILKYEDAMSGLNTVLNNSFDDNVFSVFLFNAMPASWESEMRIWRGNREILPLHELKNNLESHVTKKLAQERFALARGTPESSETQKEKALVSTAPAVTAQALIGASDSDGRCSYCKRSNHSTAQYLVLAKHLLDGEVRPNTVLPANFKIPSMLTTRNASGDQGNRHHPYPRGQNRNNNGGRRNNNQGNRNSGRSYNRNNNGYNNGSGSGNNNGSSNSGNNGTNGNNGLSNGSNYYNQANNGYRQSRHENAMIAITAATVSNFSLAASHDSIVDPVWTIDSGCTRHVVYSDLWFTTTTPYTGWITVGGKNQIPILAIGDVALRVTDSKGQPKTLKLRNVLYAPDLKFNFLSVPAAVKDDFRFSFNRTQCAITTSQRFSVKAKMAAHADLYQFTADPTMDDPAYDALISMHGSA